MSASFIGAQGAMRQPWRRLFLRFAKRYLSARQGPGITESAVYYRCVVSVALLAAGTAVPAFAQAQPAPPVIPRTTYLAAMDAEFRKMDADRDGVVTRAEIEASQRAAAAVEAARRNRALFAQLDADRNGQLSPVEFARATPPEPVNAVPLITQYDSNRDGKVSQVEYRTVKLTRFDRIDTDKDGVVSVPEQRAAGLIK